MLYLPVLEPYFNLAFSETQGMRQFDSAFAGEVAVKLELLFQLECLVASVCLSTSPPLVGVGP